MQTVADGKFVMWAVIAAAAALPLSFVHPIFALGSGFLCALFSYYVFDAISRAMFAKPFHPPAKFALPDWDKHRKWSDWLLLTPFVALAVFLIFAFGEVSDCLAGRDFWKNGWSLCDRAA